MYIAKLGRQALGGEKTAIWFTVKQTGCGVEQCVYLTSSKEKQCGTCEHDNKQWVSQEAKNFSTELHFDREE
jgi:hypothetical protein